MNVNDPRTWEAYDVEPPIRQPYYVLRFDAAPGYDPAVVGSDWRNTSTEISEVLQQHLQDNGAGRYIYTLEVWYDDEIPDEYKTEKNDLSIFLHENRKSA